MSKPVENTWELDRKIFKQVADTIRKRENKFICCSPKQEISTKKLSLDL